MPDTQTLKMALIGFRIEREKVQARIHEIEKRLGGRMTQSEPPAAAPKRRRMSAAARKRIADAQKKRWAAFHDAQKPAKRK
jgi:hypothetical protein